MDIEDLSENDVRAVLVAHTLAEMHKNEEVVTKTSIRKRVKAELTKLGASTQAKWEMESYLVDKLDALVDADSHFEAFQTFKRSIEFDPSLEPLMDNCLAALGTKVILGKKLERGHILFDTHGESVGRGAHPGSLADRLKYLSPTASRQALNRAGLSVREESAFQGGDGYLLFGTPELALATITGIARQTYHPAAGPIEDPVYANPDFAADFFATVRAGMEALVDDQGYAALLGAFGLLLPALRWGA
jgi:hypothetical protein